MAFKNPGLVPRRKSRPFSFFFSHKCMVLWQQKMASSRIVISIKIKLPWLGFYCLMPNRQSFLITERFHDFLNWSIVYCVSHESTYDNLQIFHPMIAILTTLLNCDLLKHLLNVIIFIVQCCKLVLQKEFRMFLA